MAAAFLHSNLVASGTISSGYSTIPVSSMPLSNLTDVQPRHRARWEAATATIQVDFGAAAAISCVALIGTSLGAGAQIRVRLSDAELLAPPTWDTGWIDCDTDAAAAGNVVIVHAASATGRYLRAEVTDAGASVIDIGRIVAGPLWRLARKPSYGSTEGRMILDRRDRNPHTGAEFAVPAVVNPRMTTFTLGLVTPAEAIGEWRAMRDALGGVGDALWIPDDSLALAEMNQRAIWGGVQAPGESLLSRVHFRGHSRNFSIVERV